MKKLLAAVIMSMAAIGTAQAAAPSVEDGLSIYKFCGQMGKDVSNMYILKERGFDKQYVIEAVVSEGGACGRVGYFENVDNWKGSLRSC